MSGLFFLKKKISFYFLHTYIMLPNRPNSNSRIYNLLRCVSMLVKKASTFGNFLASFLAN